MNIKLTALALSIWLCTGPAITATSMAALTSDSGTIPMLKSSITNTTTNLELTLGKAQVLHLNTPASRVSISDPEVVGLVLISPTEIQLIGKSIGVANLLIWSEETGPNYLTIDLSVHRDVSTLAHKIRMIDPGINILPVAAEDSVILTGVAESLEKAQLAYDLARAFFSGEDKPGGGGEISSNSPGSAIMASASPKIINLIRIKGQPTTKAEMVQERLKDIDPGITLNVVPGFGGKEKAILTGRVKNTSMVSKAVNLTSIFYGTPGIKILAGPAGNLVKEGKELGDASSYEAGGGGGLVGNLAGNVLHGSIITDSSGNVISMLEVAQRPQVRCSIKFLEVRKSNDVDLHGTTLLDSQDVKASTYAGGVAQFTPDNLVSQITGSGAARVGIRWGNELSSLLSALITSGRARVLAEPTITSISGEPASFLAGGEFPIPLIGTNGGVSVIFKEFGIRLNILATATERGTIHMQVSPEVSSLDPQAGININGLIIPGLRTRRSQTVLELKDGENFVLSGLFNEDMTDTLIRTPLLGQIPILGALFRSQEYQNNKTEMVIVIHPEIVNSNDGLIQSSSAAQTTEVATTNEVKQVVKLDPQEVFSQLGIDPAKLQGGINPSQQSELFQTDKASQTMETSQNLTQTVSDKTLSNREKMKAIENVQDQMMKVSQKVSLGEIVKPVPSASEAETSLEINAAKVAGSPKQPEIQGINMMAQVSETSQTAASEKTEQYLKEAKKELEDLIGRLTQPGSGEMIPMSSGELKTLDKPLQSQQMAEPLQSELPRVKQAVQESAAPPKKPTPEVQAPSQEKSDTSEPGQKDESSATQVNVSNRRAVKQKSATTSGRPFDPFKTSQLVSKQIKQLQKQLTSFLNFDGF